MLLIRCPWCGERPELEFTYGGQAHLTRPAEAAGQSDQEWSQFLYMRENVRGLRAERWRHARGCGRFFNALRDTTTDRIDTIYPMGEPRPGSART